MKTVTGTVTIIARANGTIDFAVVLTSGEMAAGGQGLMFTAAAIQIGTAFLKAGE